VCPTGSSDLGSDNITVILHRPSIPENIGSVARVMGNTGFSRLIISSPQTEDWQTAEKLAVSSSDLLRNAEIYQDLKGALSASGSQYIVGTTGRDRKYWNTREVSDAASGITARACRERVGILFGPENTGLTNEELTLCHIIVTLPSRGVLGSYNLSHAVAIVLFALMVSDLPDEKPTPKEIPGFDELEGMYGHLEELLTETGFLWEDNPDHMMRAVREFLNRAGPSEAEVRMIRGICRRLLWHLRNR
jgi:tRNA/rRNA methyltransferase